MNYKFYPVKYRDLRTDREENIYFNAFMYGLFLGMILGGLAMVIFTLPKANAQVQMSASVPKSAYYLCQEKCEELINGEF